jgi:flagellar motility protein MotE (MotC chaperone)
MAFKFRLIPTTLVVAAATLAATGFSLAQQVAQPPAKAPATRATSAAAPKAVAAPAAPQSRTEVELMGDLAKRRTALDARATQLDLQQRLLAATEKRIDAKMAELRKLEGQLKVLTGQQQEQANQRFASLVKLYETMKPKEAARIFERLDMPIQVEVATRMREARMAPVLASMSPDAAKALTTQLAARAQGSGAAPPSPAKPGT